MHSTISKQLTNLFFRDRLRNTLHNTLIILSIIKVPDEHSSGMTQKLLNFIEGEKILTWDAVYFLNDILENMKDHLSVDNLLKLCILVRASICTILMITITE
jgi:hypothetical protein